MKGIEFEEGEAYFHEDDDENIDPDRDFAYLDRKIENVLGNYQKDFMGLVSVESLGARFGDYGSFLPVQKCSTPMSFHQKCKSHVSVKSPQNLPSKPSHQYPSFAASQLMPSRSIPASGEQVVEDISKIGIYAMNNQNEHIHSRELALNQPNKLLMTNPSEKNLLKFRVKMTSESISHLDKSAIYSGLGLDMSPSPSPEASPSDNDGTSTDLQDSVLDSPSFIVKIMTAKPLPDADLISPLHDSLIHLRDMENYEESDLPGGGKVFPVDIAHEKLKHKETSKDRKFKQKDQSREPVESMRESSECPSNIVALTSTRKDEDGISTAKEVVSSASIDAIVAYSVEKEHACLSNKISDCKPLDKKNEVGFLGGDIETPMKVVSVAMDKPKEGHGYAKKHSLMEDEEDVITSKRKTERDKNIIVIRRSDSYAEKRNEVHQKEDELNNFSKQYSIPHDKVKENVLGPAHSKGKKVILIPKRESSTEKRNVDGRDSEVNTISKQQGIAKDKVKQEDLDLACLVEGDRIAKDEEACVFSLKNEKNDKYDDGFKEMKFNIGNTLEPLKHNSHSKDITRFLAKQEPPSDKDNLSSAPKKKLMDSQTSAAEPHSRKTKELASKPNSRKKGKDVSSKNFVIGVPEQETQSFTIKLKDKSSSNTSFGSNMGPNTEGIPAVDFPSAENTQIVEDWVECEKCHKWRLLPLGMSANSLTEEKWTCSMLTWLPGMNKCSFSEEETTNALYALYVPVGPASLVQKNQSAYPDVNTSLDVSAGALNVLPSQASGFNTLPSGGKKKNLVKTNMDTVQQTSLGELRNLKNLKKLPRELSIRRSGDGRPSKVEKKRLPDVEVYGVPKKMKRVRQQSTEDYDPGALRVPPNFTEESPKYPSVKAKARTQGDVKNDDELFDEYGKKRKQNNKQHHVSSDVLPSGKGGHLKNDVDAEKNSGVEHILEKRSKSSAFQAKASRAVKIRDGTPSDIAKSYLGDAVGSSLLKGGRFDDGPVEQRNVVKVAQKTPGGGRTFSERALDLGLLDNATTSSSSKISNKVKAKVNEVKSSPVGSISSSSMNFSKTVSDKVTNKKSVAYNKQLQKSGRKSGAGSALKELTPHNENFRDRKSNLSRNFAVVEEKKASYATGTQPKLEDIKNTSGKSDSMFKETSASRQNWNAENQMTKHPNRLNHDGTNAEIGRLHFGKIDCETGVSSHSHGVPELDGGTGSSGGKVDDDKGIPSCKDAINHGLRQLHHAVHASNHIEASSSRKKEYFHRDAKTALKEATDLKHSADCLKVAGSGLESTGIFFQAALKFLHGAFLLEPDNNEDRSGEMSPNGVYNTTANLCEYCALEYERCNDMAFAALAYKCMEVAYMRVVYCNDLVASRDRQELQMAVLPAPQVDSPSSSASDIDNLNQATIDTVRDGHSAMDHRSHVVSAENRPNFMRLLDFTHNINLAMEASRKSQGAFAAAMQVFTQAGNEEGILCIKNVLDFSFHDVDGLLDLVRLAMESLKS
ncbi:cysteine-tryptophan domain-containing zinc finger protein 3-like [Amaranthus tricolor]|uniref:cysteine-tryptophan domain-containing zinc finger protein 3-like n=1 Tax=Amaranthus tricolor TaxID=29722 RepID=UPI00258DF78F|nr:cysteine-tryptophan domain-containing zinc finger protein 3-like [Amaranthus tricolor]